MRPGQAALPRVRAPARSGGPRLPGNERTSEHAGLTSAGESPPRRERTEDEILALLSSGDLRPLGVFQNASNATFLCELISGETATLVVYKPRAGEAPLWDFPDGTLCLREVAAYLVSAAAGWDFVPPTILREGPHGLGAVQLFVESEPGEHYLTLGRGREDVFRRVAAFDVAINNADRKSGHCLIEKSGERIWLVDHGVSFHALPKLRTVIWDFEGEPLPPEVHDGLARAERALAGDLGTRLGSLLAPEEVEAFASRLATLRAEARFPSPGPGRPYPWPPV